MHHRPPPTILSRYSRSHFYPPSPSPASLPLSGKGKEKVKASAVEEEDVVDKEEHGVDEEGDGRFEEYSKEACDGESALLGARMFSARAGGSPLSGRGTFKTSLIVTSFFAVLLEAPVSLFNYIDILIDIDTRHRHKGQRRIS
ncbi:hypothetical protein I350_05007 [Cryptococcus amylolentus CBS 6273]|uniref:Uncharacterized protein n=1 Tax=Cryptococcus amylolentus CBS 6273 TaxID=1296118 RepID=A0A1E3JYT9_9TREE|nr:hypothetical protein I350_05007 [Cryptococcus amylolentus CBS 6273]